jgi:hypothetical protein
MILANVIKSLGSSAEKCLEDQQLTVSCTQKNISMEVSYPLPLIDYVRPYLLFIGERSAR